MQRGIWGTSVSTSADQLPTMLQPSTKSFHSLRGRDIPTTRDTTSSQTWTATTFDMGNKYAVRKTAIESFCLTLPHKPSRFFFKNKEVLKKREIHQTFRKNIYKTIFLKFLCFSPNLGPFEKPSSWGQPDPRHSPGERSPAAAAPAGRFGRTVGLLYRQNPLFFLLPKNLCFLPSKSSKTTRKGCQFQALREWVPILMSSVHCPLAVVRLSQLNCCKEDLSL